MAIVKSDEFCLENTQVVVGASSSSVSDNSSSAAFKSPGISSPTNSSPAHRYHSFLVVALFFLGSVSVWA